MDGLNNAFGGMSELDKKAFKKAEEIKSKAAAERELVDKTADGIWLSREIPDALEMQNEVLIEQIKESELNKELSESDMQEIERTRHLYSENLADMLVKDTKWYGKGSDEMVHVQATTITLFNLLEEKMGEKPFEQLKKVGAQFDEVINACRSYESKKNPLFSTGKRRKKMVVELRTQLEIMRDQFFGIMPILNQNSLDINTPFDLLTINAQSYIKSGNQVDETAVFSEKAKQLEEISEKAGDGIYLTDEMACVNSLKKRIRGEDENGTVDPEFEYNTVGLTKDIEDTEHVLRSILHSKLSRNDFKDLDRIYKGSVYLYNKQLFKLINAGGGLVDDYEGMLLMKGAKCNLTKDDLAIVRERIKEIKECEKLYKTFDSVVSDPLFDHAEFKAMMNVTESKKEVNSSKASDDQKSADRTAYNNKVKKLKDELNKNVYLTQAESEEGLYKVLR